MKRVILLLGMTMVLATPSLFADLGPHKISDPEGYCATCHNNAEQASNRGWGISIDNLFQGNWGSRPITQLCYSCHQAGGGGVGASDQSFFAMGNNHGFVVANAPPAVDDPMNQDNASVAATTLPYARTANLECTTCHNPHNSQYRPFLNRPTIQGLCVSCHPGRNYSGIRDGNTAGTYVVSTHPVNIPMDNSVGGAASIKNISEMDNALKTPLPIGDNAWVLGGKLTASQQVSCETCHAVHGSSSGVTGVEVLLAIENKFDDPNTENSPLCTGCHFGGSAGGSAGSPGTSEHPLDNNIGKAFYPEGVSLPDEWTPAGSGRIDRGTAVFNSTGTPRCSSCHDAHGGLSGTSLKRGPVPVHAENGEWCYSCHTPNPEMTPDAHHSVQGLDNGFTSALTCASCHRGGLSGHNSFYDSFVQDNVPLSFTTTMTGRSVTKDDVGINRDSALCLLCHKEDDPTRYRHDGSVISSMPSLVSDPSIMDPPRCRKGGASHYLGPNISDRYTDPITLATRNITVTLKADSWSGDNGVFSMYGNNTAGGGGEAPSVHSGSTLICESCHSVLYNYAARHPGESPFNVFRGKQGWFTNLLVYPYYEDAAEYDSNSPKNHTGVLSELCLGCHTSAGDPGHHPWETTTFSQKADQTGAPRIGAECDTPDPGAPGNLNPRFDQLDTEHQWIDCSTCHRPHSASDNSIGSYRMILEMSRSEGRWAVLCGQCHSQY
jgi:predicted CXXCH cytochrome family protein